MDTKGAVVAPAAAPAPIAAVDAVAPVDPLAPAEGAEGSEWTAQKVSFPPLRPPSTMTEFNNSWELLPFCVRHPPPASP